MINLSVQDIALLANLADCCNSVSDFRHYIVATYGTNSQLLSAHDRDGEFIVNYSSVTNLDFKPNTSQLITSYSTVDAVKFNVQDGDQLVTAVQSINKFKLGKEYDYSTTNYAGTYRLSHVTGARNQADLAVRLYASLNKLSLDLTTDYRVITYGGILQLREWRDETL